METKPERPKPGSDIPARFIYTMTCSGIGAVLGYFLGSAMGEIGIFLGTACFSFGGGVIGELFDEVRWESEKRKESEKH